MIATWFLLAAALIALAVFLWLWAALKFHARVMHDAERQIEHWRDLEHTSPFSQKAEGRGAKDELPPLRTSDLSPRTSR